MTTHKRAPSSSSRAAPLLVDSGAYSAWKSGRPVDLDAYCNWLLANQDWVSSYVALDVIIPEDPEEAARRSFNNLIYMQKRGLNPIPVFHAGEDISWLHKMLDAGCQYVGLSASSLIAKSGVDNWYSYAWSHLVNSEGLPTVKVHAFGEGRRSALLQFPWYSADTASWIQTALLTGKFRTPSMHDISIRNDQGGSRSAPDITWLDDHERDLLNAMIREHRIDISRIQDAPPKVSRALKALMTALSFLVIEKEARSLHPIKFRPNGFLNGASTQAPIDFNGLNFYLVHSTDPVSNPILAVAKHHFCLASYFYIEPIGHGTKYKFLKEFTLNPEEGIKLRPQWVELCTALKEYIHD